MITIHGLSPKQAILADIFWGLNGEDEVFGFMNSLPPAERREAEVVFNMILAAAFDEAVKDQVDDAREVLDRIRRRG